MIITVKNLTYNGWEETTPVTANMAGSDTVIHSLTYTTQKKKSKDLECGIYILAQLAEKQF